MHLQLTKYTDGHGVKLPLKYFCLKCNNFGDMSTTIFLDTASPKLSWGYLFDIKVHYGIDVGDEFEPTSTLCRKSTRFLKMLKIGWENTYLLKYNFSEKIMWILNVVYMWYQFVIFFFFLQWDSDSKRSWPQVWRLVARMYALYVFDWSSALWCKFESRSGHLCS